MGPGRGTRADRAAWILFGAALFASAEIAAGLLIGGFFDWGRAEALLFLAFRPWLLLIAALRMAEARWRRRYSLYGLALVIAGLGESLFLIGMGAADPWPEMFRGWAAGAAAAAIFDLAIQAGWRLDRRRGKAAATIVVAALLLTAGGLRPYESIILARLDPARPSAKPNVTVMTSLPIVWGEKGPFEAGGGPAQSWRSLQREFTLRPIDFIDRRSLAGARLMLLAQPRLLAPEELVALDEWVRGGGHILIFADPALAWPSALPPGDVRRPTAANMAAPLLSHWRIALGPALDLPGGIHRGMARGRIRLLRVVGTARLDSDSPDCRREASFVLDCRIGRGRAIVVADADLLHDLTSLPAGGERAERHNRMSDNVPMIADWLDRLAGIARERAAGSVDWADPAASRSGALLRAMAPIALALALALLAGLARRRNSLTYPQLDR